MIASFKMNRIRFLFLAALITCLCLIAHSPVPASATSVSWNGGDDDWSNSDMWDVGVPETEDTANLKSFGTVTLDVSTPTLHELSININGSGDMTLEHSANSLTLGTGSSLYIDSTGSGSAAYHLSDSGVLTKTSNEVKIGSCEDCTGFFNQDGGTFELSGAMYLGDYGHGIYNMTDGFIEAGPNGLGGIVLGEWGGHGEFNQFDGTVVINDLTLARQPNSTGDYYLSDGSLDVAEFEIIGKEGIGIFVQEGGLHTVQGDLTVGEFDSGTYNLKGGDLLVEGSEYIGRNAGSQGTFNQSGGYHLVEGSLLVDVAAATKGTYNLSAGKLDVLVDTVVGSSGTAVFNQSGGTNTISEDLDLGENANAGGTYSLTGGSLDVFGAERIGVYGTGHFTQKTNSAHSVGTDLVLGNDNGSFGEYNMESGSLSVGNSVLLGNSGSGTFNQSGGIHEISTDLNLGQESGTTGYYYLSDDYVDDEDARAILIVRHNEHIGVGGYGSFSQNGGTDHTIEGDLVLGNDSGSEGEFTLEEDGSLAVSKNAYIGMNGKGTFNQYDTSTFSIAGALVLAEASGSEGNYYLHGGTLTADTIVNNGTFTYSNGILAFDTFSGSGTFVGDLAVDKDETVSPGNSPGTMTIEGNYIMTDPLSTLLIELGGMEQGESYDWLEITGTATLNGTLTLDLWEGFAPETGNYFDILTASSIFGSPDDLSISGPLGYSWDLDYIESGETYTARLTVTESPVPIPAAAWLFGSAVAGIVGIRRKQWPDGYRKQRSGSAKTL